jgi:hypothetical protein
MRDSTTNSIAQLLYTERPALNFAYMVSELDATLARYPAERRGLSWDCDDVAVFELDGLRIVLGYSDDLDGQYPACLTVSVGQGNIVSGAGAALARRRATLCRRIVERLSSRHAAETMLWHEIDGQVTPDTIDSLVEALPRQIAVDGVIEPAGEIDRLMARMSAELEVRLTEPKRGFAMLQRRGGRKPQRQAGVARIGPARPVIQMPQMPLSRVPAAAAVARATADQAAADLPAAVPSLVANDVPAVPRLRDEDMIRVRAALYPPPPPAEEPAAVAPPSTQMRLAVHAMNATMTVVFLPMGAAVMTYSILRGEDMKLSGRLMALTGTALALGHSSFGQHVLSMM